MRLLAAGISLFITLAPLAQAEATAPWSTGSPSPVHLRRHVLDPRRVVGCFRDEVCE